MVAVANQGASPILKGNLFASNATQSAGTQGADLNVPQIQNSLSAPATSTVKGNLFSSIGPALGGLQAGQSVTPGTDLTTSLVSGGVSTLAGAASGALTGAAIGAAGGPIGAGGGALIGGGVALLSSSLNSFLSIRGENERKKEMDAFIKEQEEKEAKKEAQSRSDQLLNVQINRRDSERTNAINAFTAKRTMLIDAVNSNSTLKNKFIQTGIR